MGDAVAAGTAQGQEDLQPQQLPRLSQRGPRPHRAGRSRRTQEQGEVPEPGLGPKGQTLRDAQTQRRRSERRLETLTRHVTAQVASGERVSATLRKELKEQQRVAKALRDQTAQVDKKQRALDQAKAKQEQ